MAKLLSALENAKNFVPTKPSEGSLSKKWLLKEITYTEYLCVEYPHVSLKFLPGGVLQVFGEQKQPVIHRYSITHNVDKDCYYMQVFPDLTLETGIMEMDIMKNHLTLTNTSSGEIIHLNKLNLKAYNNSK